MGGNSNTETLLPLTNLSVLVSCYNKREFVEPIFLAFDELSALGAKVIVIDDGSTDGSSELLVKSCEKSKFNIYLKKTENQGAAGARNHALQVAQTDFVFYLDIDDTPNIESLCEIFQAFASSSADMAQGNFIFSETGLIGETITETDGYKTVYSADYRDRIFQTKGWWRYIYRRDFVLKVENDLNRVFNVMRGKNFVLDDVYWMLHLASIDISILESPKNKIVYNYFLPEHNGRERWASYVRQATLMPEATVLYFKSLENHDCRHDENWLYRNLFYVLWHHAPLLSIRQYAETSFQFFCAGRLVCSKLQVRHKVLNIVFFGLTPLKILKRRFS